MSHRSESVVVRAGRSGLHKRYSGASRLIPPPLSGCSGTGAGGGCSLGQAYCSTWAEAKRIGGRPTAPPVQAPLKAAARRWPLSFAPSHRRCSRRPLPRSARTASPCPSSGRPLRASRIAPAKRGESTTQRPGLKTLAYGTTPRERGRTYRGTRRSLPDADVGPVRPMHRADPHAPRDPHRMKEGPVSQGRAHR